jgi:putative inorganic carbon (hco3(-)) transporter
MFDPNDIAYVLISISPLSFYFILHREGALKRVFAIISIITSLIVILYTGSRGGMVGLLAVMAFFLFTRTHGIKIFHKIVFVLAMIMLFFSISDRIDVDRYLTLTNVGSDYNVSDEFGRLQIWKRGFDLLLSNPLTGVGVECSGMAIGYAREALGIVPRWQELHNSYIQVAVETGFPGFILFISLIFQSVKSFSKFNKIQATSNEMVEFKTISGLMLVAFIGQLVTAFFITQAYSLFFTTFFAFSAVMRNISVKLDDQQQSR